MRADTDLEAHLHRLEESLLEPTVRKSAAELAALMTEDFAEFGSSGRVYDRQVVIEALLAEPAVPWRGTLGDFAVRLLAPGTALVTYRLLPRGAAAGLAHSSLRSSIWQLEGERWRMVFHQGTPSGG